METASLTTLGYAIILTPLAASPTVALAGHFLGRRAAWGLALATGSTVLVLALLIYNKAPEAAFYIEGPSLLLVPGGGFSLSLYIDGLAALFSLIVGLVGLLVILYSYSYMAEDQGYSRYYSLLVLFLGAMEGLVLTGSLVALYVFWEMVGLCSFALIAHYYSPRASAAGVKAFLTTRIGDTALLVGIVYVYTILGSVEYPVLAASGLVALKLFLLLAFVGAVAKSAQLPLHVWLPDAMEGPTPISALIHAATMVKAGIYIVLRIASLALIGGSVALPQSFMQLVVLVGTATALYAAVSAAAQYDAKRLLAYSTISQLGFMFAALGLTWRVGVEGLLAALEHVASHAVFKALLFLAVGVVIHELEPIFGPEIARDMRYVAGAARRSPLLAASLVAGAAALAGIPPFNGAWSKEAIIGVALSTEPLVALVLLAASVATAFYSAKLVYYLVFAEPRYKEIRVEEIPAFMADPLLFLIVMTLVSPLLVVPPFKPSEAGPLAMAASLAAAAAGLGAAFLLYTRKVATLRLAALQRAALEGFYIDRIYTRIIAPSILFAANLSARGLIEIVDAVVDAATSFSLQLGGMLRSLHGGKLSYYYAVYLAGLVLLIIVALASMGD